MGKTAVIVVPTYNESATIQTLITDFEERIFPKTDWQCRILVVDGASPDGTAEAVRQLQKKYSNLDLIVEEKKEGLGAAYFKGFRWADEELHADAVVEFDGDLQHPTDAVPELLATLDGGADLVLGSRKVKGGSYPGKWDPFRLFLSQFGGWVARFLLFFPMKAFWRVTDATTGLKATRVNDKFRSLHFENFKSRGFGYKIEMLFKLVQFGAHVEEVPLKFQTREAGESKMTGQTPFEIFQTAFSLRWEHKGTRRFLKFASVGFTGYLVNAILLEVFVHLAWIARLASSFNFLEQTGILGFLAQPSGWAAAFSVEGSILNNFLWNNFWTFHKEKAANPLSFVRKFLGFNVTSFGAVIIQFVAIGLATHFFGNTTWVRQLALVATIGLLVIPYNWFMYNKVIWRRKHKKRAH
ncbi:MAG: glycosyltransferase [Spirochaetales bacterium]|nr:glycosyltransferase [Spirochaetales bacterium]